MVFEDDSRELEDPDIELRMIDAVDIKKMHHLENMFYKLNP